MIVKISKDNKLIEMGDYCDPMRIPQYLPRYQNGVMPDGTPNNEQILVGYKLNKKCEFCKDCSDCYQVILPEDYSGNINDYDFVVEDNSVKLTGFTKEKIMKEKSYELLKLTKALAATDYIFVKKTEYEIIGKTDNQYDYDSLHIKREKLRTQINVLKTELDLME